MRFACQSCGKAYNLPEEKIADKSNVKLKCRVCGAIVEVKRQGEVVAQILDDDSDNKRSRVSEAPAPLTSLGPEDMLTSMSAEESEEDATHAIAVGDQILAESGNGDEAASALLGHVRSALGQRGLGPLPPPSPTGFGPPPSPPGFGPPSPPPGFGQHLPPPGFGPPPSPVPPPLGVPEPPRVESAAAFRPEPSPPAFSAGPASPPPPLPNANPLPGPALQNALQNGSNGPVPRFGDMMPLPDEPPPPFPMANAPSMPRGAVMSAAPPSLPADMGYGGPSLEVSHAPPAGDDSTRKMLAALATGILIGFIIARLFF